MVETVLFDLDNTLLDFNQAEKNAVSKTLEHFHITPEASILKRYSELNLAQWKLLEQGKISREEVKVRRFQFLFKELGTDTPAREAAYLYESLLAQGHYFMEGAEELLENLYGRYQMYLVTNGTLSVQKGRLKSASISHYFEDIFISEELGYNKPGIEYFNCCFSRIPHFRKETHVIIGDSLTSDIQGGINAGIRTIWFHPGNEKAEEIIPDYEIHKLSEIPALLSEI